jgi:hypothetical protein
MGSLQIMLVLHFRLVLALAAQGQRVLVYVNADVVFRDTRQLGFDDQRVVGFIDVDRRGPGADLRVGPFIITTV